MLLIKKITKSKFHSKQKKIALSAILVALFAFGSSSTNANIVNNYIPKYNFPDYKSQIVVEPTVHLNHLQFDKNIIDVIFNQLNKGKSIGTDKQAKNKETHLFIIQSESSTQISKFDVQQWVNNFCKKMEASKLNCEPILIKNTSISKAYSNSAIINVLAPVSFHKNSIQDVNEVDIQIKVEVQHKLKRIKISIRTIWYKI